MILWSSSGPRAHVQHLTEIWAHQLFSIHQSIHPSSAAYPGQNSISYFMMAILNFNHNCSCVMKKQDWLFRTPTIISLLTLVVVLNELKRADQINVSHPTWIGLIDFSPAIVQQSKKRKLFMWHHTGDNIISTNLKKITKLLVRFVFWFHTQHETRTNNHSKKTATGAEQQLLKARWHRQSDRSTRAIRRTRSSGGLDLCVSW